MKEEITAILRLASERGLPSLLIGGNAIVLLGHIRNTVDLDLLVPERSRSPWLDLLRELGYRFLHGISAFAQFEPPEPGGRRLILCLSKKRPGKSYTRAREKWTWLVKLFCCRALNISSP